MYFLLNCLKGVAIGSGAILPGISSGVFCVIFGIYEKLLDSILNFFKDFRNNLKFLTPIVIGCIFGFFIFGNILNFALYKFPIQTKSIFIGLILGSIPSLIKEVNKKGKFKLSYLYFFFLTLIIGVGSVLLEKFLATNYISNVSFFYLVICGFFMSVRYCCASVLVVQLF